MSKQFTDEEVFKLKQLVCSHQNTKDKDWKCSCCQQFNQICEDCGLEIEHTCNDHDTEDGYCNSCR